MDCHFEKIIKIFVESKRTWNPLRRLRRVFRRSKQPSPEPNNEVKSLDETIEPPSSLDTSKSRSTSQLIDEPLTRNRYVQKIAN